MFQQKTDDFDDNFFGDEPEQFEVMEEGLFSEKNNKSEERKRSPGEDSLFKKTGESMKGTQKKQVQFKDEDEKKGETKNKSVSKAQRPQSAKT